MSTTGKLNHRDRKNGAAHEAWIKRKKAANAARGTQEHLPLYDEKDPFKKIGAEYYRICA